MHLCTCITFQQKERWRPWARNADWLYEKPPAMRCGCERSASPRPSVPSHQSTLSPDCRGLEFLWKVKKKSCRHLKCFKKSNRCVTDDLYSPAVNHSLWSPDVCGVCAHWGKWGLLWVWMSWTWFRIEVHLATLSGPDVDVNAVQ